MDIEHLLTATRSARKSLDLDAPVDTDDVRECLRIGLLPVARLRAGHTFSPARRRPVDEVVARDRWDGPTL